MGDVVDADGLGLLGAFARGGGVVGRGLGVDLFEEAGDERGLVGVVGALDDPSAGAAHAPAAHVEDVDGGVELVGGQGEDVGVGAVGQDDGVALEDGAQGGDVVAQPGGGLEVEGGGGAAHLLLEVGDDGPGAPLHEGAQLQGHRAVVLLADPAHAGGRALVDVAQQAGAALGPGAAEHAGRACAHGEDPHQLVDGLADGPGLDEGPEVAGAGLAGAPDRVEAGVGLPHRHRQVGVGLVVLEHDVEAGVELFDPRELEGEGLDLVAHDGPLHAGGGGDHLLGARVQVRQVLEVVGEAVAQVLGLAHVDDAAVRVREAVDAGGGGDVARGRAVGRGVCHSPQTRGGRAAARPGAADHHPGAPGVSGTVAEYTCLGAGFTEP